MDIRLISEIFNFIRSEKIEKMSNYFDDFSVDGGQLGIGSGR